MEIEHVPIVAQQLGHVGTWLYVAWAAIQLARSLVACVAELHREKLVNEREDARNKIALALAIAAAPGTAIEDARADGSVLRLIR